MTLRASLCAFPMLALGLDAEASAQSVTNNAITSAQDAFGSSFNNENVGLYSTSNVRGFSPIDAGNIRLEGLYFDRVSSFSARLIESNQIRVGVTAQDYLLPAPSGIVDFHLRPAGPNWGLSAVATVNGWGGRQIEVDAQLPVVRHSLEIAAGGALVDQESAGAARSHTTSLAFAPHWQVSDKIAVTGFWNRVTFDGQVDPIFVPGAGRMPVPVSRRTFYGVPWLTQRNTSTHYGVLSSIGFGDSWNARLGFFRSISDTPENHAELILGLDEDGTAIRKISKDPFHRLGSTSGEARLSRDVREGPRLHSFIISLRGRDRTSLFGGGSTLQFPRASIIGDNPEEPAFTPGPVTEEHIRQWTIGLAYALKWKGLGSLGIGVQRTDYRDSVHVPNVGTTLTHTPAWLPTATLALDASPDLAFYGSYTKGIESSGIAPDTAANRTAVLPAKETEQLDLGLRWKAPLGLRVVAGAFSISKPYFAANAQNVYTELGTLKHRGLELSVNGTPMKGLRIVAGAVLLGAVVTGSPADQGRVGRTQLDQAKTTFSFNANYDAARVRGLSLWVKVVSRSSRFADSLDSVKLPPVTIVDAGLRYRFKLFGTDALGRLTVQNIGNANDWQIVGSGGYQIYTARQVSCALIINL